MVGFNLEHTILQPIFHSIPNAVFHDFTFYHLAIAPTGLAAIPCDRTLSRMGEIPLHDSTALFTEQDTSKRFLQFLGGMG